MRRIASIILSIIIMTGFCGCANNSFEAQPSEQYSNTANSGENLSTNTNDEGEFHMIPNSNSSTSFVIIADSHIGKNDVFSDTLNKTIDWINKNEQINFVLYTGDNIDDGFVVKPNNPQIKTFFEINNTLNVPYYAIRGNHDPAVNEFEKNTYIECGDTVIIGFNAEFYVKVQAEFPKNNGYVYPEDIEWLEGAFERANGKRIILACHHSIVEDFKYPICAAGPVPEKNLEWVDFGREKILELAEKYNIELYFNGHEHEKDAVFGKAGPLTDYSLPALGEQRQFTVVTVNSDKAIIEIHNARRGDEIVKSYEYIFVK